MKSLIFFTRVIPISFFTAILLINFQNCAKPNALSGEGQTVVSNPNNLPSSSGPATADGIFQPATQVPPNGLGSNQPQAPSCLIISDARQLVGSGKSKLNDPLLLVTVQLRRYYLDKNGKIKTDSNPVTFNSGQLFFQQQNISYEYNFAAPEQLEVKEAEFIVPYSVYEGMGKPIVTGYFDGNRYDPIFIEYCNSEKKSVDDTPTEK